LSYYETDSVIGKVISEAEFGGDTKDIGLLSDWSSVFFSGDSSKYEQYP